VHQQCKQFIAAKEPPRRTARMSVVMAGKVLRYGSGFDVRSRAGDNRMGVE
jgi:hypothetical protein